MERAYAFYQQVRSTIDSNLPHLQNVIKGYDTRQSLIVTLDLILTKMLHTDEGLSDLLNANHLSTDEYHRLSKLRNLLERFKIALGSTSSTDVTPEQSKEMTSIIQQLSVVSVAMTNDFSDAAEYTTKQMELEKKQKTGKATFVGARDVPILPAEGPQEKKPVDKTLTRIAFFFMACQIVELCLNLTMMLYPDMFAPAAAATTTVKGTTALALIGARAKTGVVPAGTQLAAGVELVREIPKYVPGIGAMASALGISAVLVTSAYAIAKEQVNKLAAQELARKTKAQLDAEELTGDNFEELEEEEQQQQNNRKKARRALAKKQKRQDSSLVGAPVNATSVATFTPAPVNFTPIQNITRPLPFTARETGVSSQGAYIPIVPPSADPPSIPQGGGETADASGNLFWDLITYFFPSLKSSPATATLPSTTNKPSTSPSGQQQQQPRVVQPQQVEAVTAGEEGGSSTDTVSGDGNMLTSVAFVDSLIQQKAFNLTELLAGEQRNPTSLLWQPDPTSAYKAHITRLGPSMSEIFKKIEDTRYYLLDGSSLYLMENGSGVKDKPIRFTTYREILKTIEEIKIGDIKTFENRITPLDKFTYQLLDYRHGVASWQLTYTAKDSRQRIAQITSKVTSQGSDIVDKESIRFEAGYAPGSPVMQEFMTPNEIVEHMKINQDVPIYVSAGSVSIKLDNNKKVVSDMIALMVAYEDLSDLGLQSKETVPYLDMFDAIVFRGAWDVGEGGYAFEGTPRDLLNARSTKGEAAYDPIRQARKIIEMRKEIVQAGAALAVDVQLADASTKTEKLVNMLLTVCTQFFKEVNDETKTYLNMPACEPMLLGPLNFLLNDTITPEEVPMRWILAKRQVITSREVLVNEIKSPDFSRLVRGLLTKQHSDDGMVAKIKHPELTLYPVGIMASTNAPAPPTGELTGMQKLFPINLQGLVDLAQELLTPEELDGLKDALGTKKSLDNSLYTASGRANERALKEFMTTLGTVRRLGPFLDNMERARQNHAVWGIVKNPLKKGEVDSDIGFYVAVDYAASVHAQMGDAVYDTTWVREVSLKAVLNAELATDPNILYGMQHGKQVDFSESGGSFSASIASALSIFDFSASPFSRELSSLALKFSEPTNTPEALGPYLRELEFHLRDHSSSVLKQTISELDRSLAYVVQSTKQLVQEISSDYISGAMTKPGSQNGLPLFYNSHYEKLAGTGNLMLEFRAQIDEVTGLRELLFDRDRTIRQSLYDLNINHPEFGLMIKKLVEMFDELEKIQKEVQGVIAAYTTRYDKVLEANSKTIPTLASWYKNTGQNRFGAAKQVVSDTARHFVNEHQEINRGLGMYSQYGTRYRESHDHLELEEKYLESKVRDARRLGEAKNLDNDQDAISTTTKVMAMIGGPDFRKFRQNRDDKMGIIEEYLSKLLGDQTLLNRVTEFLDRSFKERMKAGKPRIESEVLRDYVNTHQLAASPSEAAAGMSGETIRKMAVAMVSLSENFVSDRLTIIKNTMTALDDSATAWEEAGPQYVKTNPYDPFNTAMADQDRTEKLIRSGATPLIDLLNAGDKTLTPVQKTAIDIGVLRSMETTTQAQRIVNLLVNTIHAYTLQHLGLKQGAEMLQSEGQTLPQITGWDKDLHSVMNLIGHQLAKGTADDENNKRPYMPTLKTIVKASNGAFGFLDSFYKVSNNEALDDNDKRIIDLFFDDLGQLMRLDTDNTVHMDAFVSYNRPVAVAHKLMVSACKGPSRVSVTDVQRANLEFENFRNRFQSTFMDWVDAPTMELLTTYAQMFGVLSVVGSLAGTNNAPGSGLLGFGWLKRPISKIFRPVEFGMRHAMAATFWGLRFVGFLPGSGNPWSLTGGSIAGWVIRLVAGGNIVNATWSWMARPLTLGVCFLILTGFIGYANAKTATVRRVYNQPDLTRVLALGGALVSLVISDYWLQQLAVADRAATTFWLIPGLVEAPRQWGTMATLFLQSIPLASGIYDTAKFFNQKEFSALALQQDTAYGKYLEGVSIGNDENMSFRKVFSLFCRRPVNLRDDNKAIEDLVAYFAASGKDEAWIKTELFPRYDQDIITYDPKTRVKIEKDWKHGRPDWTEDPINQLLLRLFPTTPKTTTDHLIVWDQGLAPLLYTGSPQLLFYKQQELKIQTLSGLLIADYDGIYGAYKSLDRMSVAQSLTDVARLQKIYDEMYLTPGTRLLVANGQSDARKNRQDFIAKAKDLPLDGLLNEDLKILRVLLPKVYPPPNDDWFKNTVHKLLSDTNLRGPCGPLAFCTLPYFVPMNEKTVLPTRAWTSLLGTHVELQGEAYEVVGGGEKPLLESWIDECVKVMKTALTTRKTPWVAPDGEYKGMGFLRNRDYAGFYRLALLIRDVHNFLPHESGVPNIELEWAPTLPPDLSFAYKARHVWSQYKNESQTIPKAPSPLNSAGEEVGDVENATKPVARGPEISYTSITPSMVISEAQSETIIGLGPGSTLTDKAYWGKLGEQLGNLSLQLSRYYAYMVRYMTEAAVLTRELRSYITAHWQCSIHQTNIEFCRALVHFMIACCEVRDEMKMVNHLILLDPEVKKKFPIFKDRVEDILLARNNFTYTEASKALMKEARDSYGGSTHDMVMNKPDKAHELNEARIEQIQHLEGIYAASLVLNQPVRKDEIPGFVVARMGMVMREFFILDTIFQMLCRNPERQDWLVGYFNGPFSFNAMPQDSWKELESYNTDDQLLGFMRENNVNEAKYIWFRGTEMEH